MTKTVNLLFINPCGLPSDEQRAFLDKSSILRVPDYSMPIGIIDLSAYLREHIDNLNIKILDVGKDLNQIYLHRDETPPMTLEEFIKKELDSIDFKPDIIGVSILFSASHNSSFMFIEEAKKRWKDATVICGGNHATNLVPILLKNNNIDYVLRGEGEIPFTEFIKQYQAGKKINVFGIIDRKKLKTSPDEFSPLIMDLDELPFPAYDLLDLDVYRETVGASIMFSRGCCFKCAFCASHTIHGRKVRFKSNKRIYEEFLLLLQKYKFDKIIIEDDLFAANKKNFLEIAKKIIDLDLNVKYYLPQGLSVATLDEEIIDMMIKMKIDEASLAIESGSTYTQKHIIKKNVDLDKARKLLDYFRSKDFFTYVNFILGFSRETKELMQETVDYIKTIDVDWVYFFHAIPLPGSDMYKDFISRGIIDPEKIDWDGVRLGRREFDTPEISAEDLKNLLYDTNIDCNFFNHSNLRYKRYERAIDVFHRIILVRYPFHIVARYCTALAYIGLGEKEKAENEFKQCVEWINKDAESKRLWDRYGHNMELLKPYMELTVTS